MILKKMGPIRNLIDDESRVLDVSTGNWVTDSSNSLFRSSKIEYGSFSNTALGVDTLGTDNAVAEIFNIRVPSELRRLPVRFSALIQTSIPAKATVEIELTGDNAGTWTSALEIVEPDEWTLLSVITEVTATGPIFSSTTAKISVNADWSETQTIEWQGEWDSETAYTENDGVYYNDAAWVATGEPPAGEVPKSPSSYWVETTKQQLFVLNPALCVPQEAFYNVSAIEAYVRMPEYLRAADTAQENPDYPLYRFSDVLNSVTYEVDRKWAEFRYISPEDNQGVLKDSSLVNPLLADFDTVTWLAQFVGVDLVDLRTGFTSWAALMNAADPNPDIPDPENPGETLGLPSWGEWNTVVGGPDTTIQWNEIEDFSVETVSSSALLAFLRWQVLTAVYGLRAGTSESLVEAARQGLKSSTSQVEIVRHVDGDPFKINVIVDSADLKTSLQSVQEFIDPAIPAGFEVIAITG